MKELLPLLALAVLASATPLAAQQPLEPLVLPRAEFSEPDDGPLEQRPVLNVLQSGAIVYQGKVAFDPAKHKDKDFTPRLLRVLRKIRRRIGKSVDAPVLIRADKWTPWQAVSRLMQDPSMAKLRLRTVQLGVAERDRETGERNARLGTEDTPDTPAAQSVEFAESLEARIDAPRLWTGDPRRSGERELLTVSVLVDVPGARAPDVDRPARVKLTGHKLLWKVGDRYAYSLEDLGRVLELASADPTQWAPDPKTGERKLVGCVIQSSVDACYEDVIRTYDAIRGAGFTDVAYSAVGVGDGAGGRYADRSNARKHEKSDRPQAAAIDRGLAWLAAHQDEDGRWDALAFAEHDDPARGDRCDGRANPVHNVGISGLALLALLGDGNTLRTGPYRDNVRRGVMWLRKQQQANGLFGTNHYGRFIYDHAIATYAMGEAYGLSDVELLKGSAQKGIDYLEFHRNPRAVWRYRPRDNDNDLSVTGWCVMAYETGRHFGLKVNEEALDICETFLKQISDATGTHGYTKQAEGSQRRRGEHATKFPGEKVETLTAVGLFCRYALGQAPEKQPFMSAAADRLLSKPPVWDEQAGTIDLYYWYYGAHALHQFGGKHWETWKKHLSKALVQQQHSPKNTENANLHGSWDPVGVWGGDGGRVYSTAMGVLTLEAYYRYSRPMR